MEPVQPADIFVLSGLHLLLLLLMGGLVWRWLPRVSRVWAGGLALFAFGWSLSALLNFYAGGSGFWSWFLDPAAEKNLTALFTSVVLSGISLTAFALWWQTRLTYDRGYQAGWWLIGLTFGFLGVDEYASLHESVVFWRQGYAVLGGGMALWTLWLIRRSAAPLSCYLMVFLAGLGALGIAGVFLDAFSTQNIIDVGPINLTFLACRGEALGVMCRDYGNTEEFLEVVGAGLMWLALLAALQHTRSESASSGGVAWLVRSGVLAWALLVIGWLWIAPALESRLATSAPVTYGDVSLTAFALSQQTLDPGETLDVTLYGQVNQAIQRDYSMSLHLYTHPLPEIESVAQDDMQLGEFNYPTRAWLPGVPVRNRFQLDLSDDLTTAASYRLVAMLWYDTPSNRVTVQQTELATLSDGTITVLEALPALPMTAPPEPPNTPDYQFAEGFSLTGYDLPQSVQAGEEVTVRFWWQTQQPVQTELTHFLHAFEVETGEYVIFDQTPFDGRFPTDDWPAGMQVMDSWMVTLSDDVPAGTYRLETGLYDVVTQERMPVTTADGTSVQNASIVLGDVTVTAAASDE